MQAQRWQDVFFTARDGLRLYARHYPAAGGTRRPVVCLPGLTRNSRDFHDLASALSDPDGHRRAVWALDYRGRGRSAHDPDWKNYSIFFETLDVLDLMTLAGLSNATILGTSRGGLIAMLIATMRPTAMGAVVLNDIGPVIERDGLARIVAYVGRVPLPKTWAEATELVAGMSRRQFPAVPEAQWGELARQWFNDDQGRPIHAYDQKLTRATSLLEGPIPTLWPQFQAMSRMPMLVIRGENSDILAARTVVEMRLRHSRLETLTVKGQGHAPLLKDAPTIEAVSEFLMRADETRTGLHAMVV